MPRWFDEFKNRTKRGSGTELDYVGFSVSKRLLLSFDLWRDWRLYVATTTDCLITVFRKQLRVVKHVLCWPKKRGQRLRD